MGKVSWIYHKGIKIVHLDLANALPRDFYPVLEEGAKVIRYQVPNSVFTLTDVINARYNRDISQKMKEFTRENKPYVKAAAVLGITGLKKIIFSAILKFSKRTIQVCNNIEEAKEWLVEQK